MADAYKAVRTGGLKLKGSKKLKKRKRVAEEESGPAVETRHGAFWLVDKIEQLTGNVLIETQTGGYLTAIDDGTLSTALPREVDNDPENMPEPQDIFTMVAVSESRVAFKTAYGRYVSSAPVTGDVSARTEAMGVRELWMPMMEEGGVLKFRSADKKYFTTGLPGAAVHATSDSASDPGISFRVHSSAALDTARPKKQGEYDIEGGTLKNMEESFVKRFQSFQSETHKEGNKVRITSEDRKALRKAQKDGSLHGQLLIRRAKMKSDKYC